MSLSNRHINLIKNHLDNNKIARRARAILINNDLIPAGLDPWKIYDLPHRNINEFEREVSLRRAFERMKV